MEKLNNNRILFKIFSVVLFLFFINQLSYSENSILKIDTRHRPPEIFTDGKKHWGPLLDIIKEAAEKAGYKVKFQKRQGGVSLKKLAEGEIDILPRVQCTKKRAKLFNFIGPIGFQEKVIFFMVKPGKEDSIKTFGDLKKFMVGVKRGTYYFKEFNENREIQKIESHDDDDMVKMFKAGRFDVVAVLDRGALDTSLKKHNITGYVFAEYKYYKRIGNYYGISSNNRAKDKLQKALEDMVVSGRVKEIYMKNDAKPPIFDHDSKFVPCLAN